MIELQLDCIVLTKNMIIAQVKLHSTMDHVKQHLVVRSSMIIVCLLNLQMTGEHCGNF
jgi:hypothetical protein